MRNIATFLYQLFDVNYSAPRKSRSIDMRCIATFYDPSIGVSYSAPG